MRSTTGNETMAKEPHRQWFQFGMGKMFAVVTVAALLVWLYQRPHIEIVGHLPRADMDRWKRYSVIGLAAVVVVMGFWIPAPLFRLIQGAVGIVVGG